MNKLNNEIWVNMLNQIFNGACPSVKKWTDLLEVNQVLNTICAYGSISYIGLDHAILYPSHPDHIITKTSEITLMVNDVDVLSFEVESLVYIKDKAFTGNDRFEILIRPREAFFVEVPLIVDTQDNTASLVYEKIVTHAISEPSKRMTNSHGQQVIKRLFSESMEYRLLLGKLIIRPAR